MKSVHVNELAFEIDGQVITIKLKTLGVHMGYDTGEDLYLHITVSSDFRLDNYMTEGISRAIALIHSFFENHMTASVVPFEGNLDHIVIVHTIALSESDVKKTLNKVENHLSKMLALKFDGDGIVFLQKAI